MTQTPSALDGIRVIDMSRVFAAPVGAQILGDLGADVIKIERPGVGDDGRGYGTAWIKGKDGLDTRQSSFFTVSNRNKRSITVNHSKPEGQEIIRALAKDADVLIENYKVGDLQRYGLDYESLKAINPRLIYCSVTGYGQTGPMAAKPGYDWHSRWPARSRATKGGAEPGRFCHRPQHCAGDHGRNCSPPHQRRGSIYRHRPARYLGGNDQPHHAGLPD
jgi:crotonobetainyl-CoA:carnitine CoA-transferase CaiB-like acyl-CoA transferase